MANCMVSIITNLIKILDFYRFINSRQHRQLFHHTISSLEHPTLRIILSNHLKLIFIHKNSLLSILQLRHLLFSRQRTCTLVRYSSTHLTLLQQSRYTNDNKRIQSSILYAIYRSFLTANFSSSIFV